jgi:hypothetical protein
MENDKPKLIEIWYLYSDGSRVHNNQVNNITVFSFPKWLLRMFAVVD